MNTFKMVKSPPPIGGTFRTVRKTVKLSDGREIEFDVKVCRPQRAVEQRVYSLCYARCADCVHNTGGFGGIGGIPRHLG